MTPPITVTHSDRALSLTADGALTIQELGTSSTIVLKPDVVAALQAFFQRNDVQLYVESITRRPSEPLSGLVSRHYVHGAIEREVRLASSHQRPLGIIMLDIDRFHRFNDLYGHMAGDTLLYIIGEFLQLSIRTGDIACRYDSEEFMLVLPGASLADTQRRAEDVRNGVKQLQFQHLNQPTETVTISVGVASYPDNGTSAEELIDATERAMYQAKAEGRDRVVTLTPTMIYDDEV